MFRNIFLPVTSYKFLLFQLTMREIKARYKQSFVGYAWVVLNPLAQLLVYSFVFSIVFRFPTNNVPYIAFLYTCLLPWTLFSNSLLSATQSLVDNAPLLKKVAFPREIIPYASVLSKIVDFSFSLLFFLALLFFLHIPVSLSMVFFVPLLITQLFLTIGIALFFSMCNLFYRDISHLTNLLLMLWMYMTPIVYPLSLVPKQFIWVYKLNPLVGIMEGYRSAIFGYPFEISIILWSMAVSLTVFISGYYLFKRTEKMFADIV